MRDLNDSPLMFTRHHNPNGAARIIWHQAEGESWPDDGDTVWYVWEDDGNTAIPEACTWGEFRENFQALTL